MINFLPVVISLILSLIHPFHVSVCDVEFNEEAKSIQLSQRIFLDDLEQTLNKKYKIHLIIDKESSKAYRDSLIQVYLFESIHLSVEGKKKKPVYIGNEIEDDAMWCYIEYSGIKKFKSLKIKSTVLIETFEDQANIIHFTYGDYEKSIKLDKLKTTGTFKPDK
jgi:hypothetical protein